MKVLGHEEKESSSEGLSDFSGLQPERALTDPDITHLKNGIMNIHKWANEWKNKRMKNMDLCLIVNSSRTA